MILITGAAGKTGRAVIQALHNRRVDIRAFVRSKEQGELVQSLGAAEAYVGDLLNISDLATAVKDIRAVYHICPNMHAEEVNIGQLMLNACVGKVERFVYHSVFHPQIEAMPHHWNKLRVEEMLFGSKLPFTILQPTAYMQNVLARMDEVRKAGVFRVPYSVLTRVSMVDLLDVAEVSAKMLTESGYLGGTYELVGPGYFSQEEIAADFGRVLGYPVQAEEIPLAVWKAQAEQDGLGEYAVDTLLKMFTYYDKFNFMGNIKVLESLLGRKPTSFEDFLLRNLSN
jgi:uncharacterized protein YbjT (DUF2867 family)